MAYHLNIIRQEYGRRTLLHDLRQDYAAGRIHGFLGENGAGKTTLFRCMAGRLPFEGEPMFSPETRVGFLPAELYMYPMITGREFLQFYVTARGLSWDAARLERLNAAFELPLDEYAEVYSTGMLKKLYLMGLLLQDNAVLLLDEPFNGLDFRSSAFVTALLTEYRRRGQTVFVASHDLDHLLSYADTLSWLRCGTMTYYPDRTAFEDVRQAIRREAAERVQGADLL